MHTNSYSDRRAQLTTYFDHTAAAAWRALTSTDPVGRIRATVRAGRDDMRRTLLGWLPQDMRGQTLVDAGCGTGALAIEAARRGADVVGIDVAASLVSVARKRAARETLRGSVDFIVGDMLEDAPSGADHIVAMDSLIHYEADDVVATATRFLADARESVLFTSAPWTRALAAMHFVGRLVPHRGHRAPAIVPVRIGELIAGLESAVDAGGWLPARTCRIKSGFYFSQAIGLRKSWDSQG